MPEPDLVNRSGKVAGGTSGEYTYRQIALNAIAEDTGAGPIRLKITSNSMRPLLRPGDVVVMSQLKAGEIPQRGDIIVIQPNDSAGSALPLTHRLIGRSAAGWLTKGDYRWFPDDPVNPHAVVGQATAIQRGERWIDLSTPAWRLANRLLGWIHFMVGSLMALARQLRRSLED